MSKIIQLDICESRLMALKESARIYNKTLDTICDDMAVRYIAEYYRQKFDFLYDKKHNEAVEKANQEFDASIHEHMVKKERKSKSKKDGNLIKIAEK